MRRNRMQTTKHGFIWLGNIETDGYFLQKKC